MPCTLFIIGMHRSATSAFAGSMMLLEPARPLRMQRADDSNPKGYFEPKEVVHANEAP